MTDRYPMQMGDRELELDDAMYILDKGEYCVVSTVDPDGTPYGVPLSYVIMDGKMYFHTGERPGHKIDDFEHDPRVSVTVAIDIDPCFEETFFTTRFASVIAAGRVSHIEDRVTIRKVLVKLCMKYLPQFKDEIGAAIEREIDVTGIWCIELDEIRGKAGRWLKSQR